MQLEGSMRIPVRAELRSDTVAQRIHSSRTKVTEATKPLRRRWGGGRGACSPLPSRRNTQYHCEYSFRLGTTGMYEILVTG